MLETREQVAQLELPQPAAPSERSRTRGETPLPSISAVIPLYNGSKFIEAALQSVFAQTIAPREVIVVDDGSTDQGPALVKAMAERYPIVLLSQPNGGQSAARNFGVAHSTGELIALLDQDDIWYPPHIELWCNLLSNVRPVRRSVGSTATSTRSMQMGR